MATKNSLEQAPYDKQGNLLGYAGHIHDEWKPNEPMTLTLTYHGFSRGMSSAKIHWRDAEGHDYPMFLADLDDVMQAFGQLDVARDTDPLTITAQWLVRKRGQNYGIALAWIW